MTLEIGPDAKQMKLRYAGTCRLCETPLPAGSQAFYERSLKTVRCIECAIEIRAPDVGTAGASARREYERRKDNRERRIRESHPKLGGLILALSEDPESTRAWERGALGEELVAQRLEDLPNTFRVLHDRRIPGTRANIDHIVTGPSGVWVIDAKRYKNKRPALHVEGGILRPRVESLRMGETARSSSTAPNCRSTESSPPSTTRRSPSPACCASWRQTGLSSADHSR